MKWLFSIVGLWFIYLSISNNDDIAAAMSLICTGVFSIISKIDKLNKK